MSSPPFDVAKAHRWFAIELNNRAWDLIESPARTVDEVAEMLSVAHGSRYHWEHAGTTLNHLRAELLVAAAYLAAAKPDLSLAYAQRALVMGEQPNSGATPFDRASIYGALASALSQLGDREQAAGYYRQALEHAAHFEHADDRAVFDKLYPALS